jgi:hypothetical protein
MRFFLDQKYCLALIESISSQQGLLGKPACEEQNATESDPALPTLAASASKVQP